MLLCGNKALEKVCKLMESFVVTPNLPDNKVTLAAAGDYPEIINALNGIGVKTVCLENKILPREVSRHSDMLICHTGENALFCDPSQDIDMLEAMGFITEVCSPLGEKYPEDVRLNVAAGYSFFIYNPLTADTMLSGELMVRGKKPIAVRQGYSKCSVCFVTENAFITDDEGIKRASADLSADVLLISKGDVYLSDNHYGFFGGCTGKLDKDTLAVTGELKYHRDGERIRAFCEKHGVSILELTRGRLTDIGGILPLKQRL